MVGRVSRSCPGNVLHTLALTHVFSGGLSTSQEGKGRRSTSRRGSRKRRGDEEEEEKDKDEDEDEE